VYTESVPHSDDWPVDAFVVYCFALYVLQRFRRHLGYPYNLGGGGRAEVRKIFALCDSNAKNAYDHWIDKAMTD
jgi:hypothetical protein